jgi:predicted NBD/HSP70 family sugar kinase
MNRVRRLNLKKVQTARLATIRDINRQIVLNYVREREPISRATIAKETALQRSTVSAIVDCLQNEGLVEEVGEGESTGGRRPTLLRLRTAGAMAIGVSVTPSHITIATCDLAGRILQQREFPIDPDYDRSFQQINNCINELKAHDGAAIESVGVSLPGLIDPSTGTAIYVPYFHWRDLPVAKIISSATSLPVTIDNDANAMALAELWFGRPEATDARDFILILVAEGVGTGIIIDGQVYRGQRGAAGEFGHMIVGTQAPVACSCGNYDCWEAFSSERAAVARYNRLTSSANDGPTVDFTELIDRALGHEPQAKRVLAETARYLGIGISNLVVGFSPEVVIVGGQIARAWSLIQEALGQTIERSVRRGLPSARILASTLDKEPTLMGALSLVLASKFAAAFAA